MKLAIAGDSAGAGLAHQLAEHLKDRYQVAELSKSADGSDEFYANLSDRVASAGIGVSISANKVPGIRAALCHDTYSAERAALSNNAQIITMGARVIGVEVAKTIADAYLAQTFDEAGRSASNVAAINEVDAKYHG
jgi:ribose 5-phosphate isomerase B